MDIQKEREAFEQLPEINQWIDALKYGEKTGVYIAIDNNKHDGVANWVNGAWFMWQAAKAQSVPDGYKVVPVNYECAWCGCTELDGWTDEAMLEAQETK